MKRLNDLNRIAELLGAAKTIAVVGCSPDPSRPSNAIACYLIREGFDVIPVNPAATEVLGRRSYPDLESIPRDVHVDVVDVFRRSEFVAEVAEAALRRGGITLFFMQDGVVDEGSAKRLAEAGVSVAMDRCIYRDHSAFARTGVIAR